ncbi:hypothetical protein HUU62_10935 [Rhodoferax sp. 4810]|nr:hypothetical protein [Rhodoferax jenense]
MANEEKIAHLGFIQGVIDRMGNNSFLIKGWVVTLVAAIVALSADKVNTNFTYLALFPLIFFWWLDAFFLHQEKLYRKLYERVADNTEPSNIFSMNAHKYKDEVDCFSKVLISNTLRNFYGPITILVLIFMWKTIDLIKLC